MILGDDTRDASPSPLPEFDILGGMSGKAIGGIPPEFLTRLGQVVAIFGAFETQIPNHIARLVGVAPPSVSIHAMLKRTQLGALMTMLEDLVTMRVSRETELQEEARALFAHFNKLNAERNKLVHAWWHSHLPGEEGDVTAIAFRYSRGGKGFSGALGQFMPLSRLSEIASEMRAFVTELDDFVERLSGAGGPPQGASLVEGE